MCPGLGGLRISAPAVPQTGFAHQAAAPVIPAVNIEGAMVVEDESVGLRGLHPGNMQYCINGYITLQCTKLVKNYNLPAGWVTFLSCPPAPV